ncbi:hypothetical protein [Rhizohabitans arisaemae]|uniref:hypothetical protein n=1 Tax=Rhizohabitans arisaemae TaxID=2720610 RepID=UPI0024B15D9B|nr:hypothetical protein [Rhizohabitans arisaemae]
MKLTTSDDIAELRLRVSAVLASLIANPSSAQPVDLPDIPGHWLGPAVEAVVSVVRGEDPAAPLAVAGRRDERRTALFLCLVLAACGKGDRVHASWLGTAFGGLPADPAVTREQRAIWISAAQGAYGPAGQIFVLRRLGAVSPSDSEPWLDALIPPVETVPLPPALTDVPALAEPGTAAKRLAALRKRCEEITDVGGEPPGRPGADPLQALIDDEPEISVGTLHTLLADDLRPGADPRLAVVALHVAAPALRSGAERLAQIAGAPPPEEIAVRVDGHRIGLRQDGPVAGTLAEAERRILLDVPRSAVVGARRLDWIYITLGLICALIALPFQEWLLVGGGLALAAVSSFFLWHHGVRHREATERAARRVLRLGKRATEAAEHFRAHLVESGLHRGQAEEDLAAIKLLLKRGPRAV